MGPAALCAVLLVVCVLCVGCQASVSSTDVPPIQMPRNIIAVGQSAAKHASALFFGCGFCGRIAIVFGLALLLSICNQALRQAFKKRKRPSADKFIADSTPAASTAVDADVIIVGAGIVGGSLSTVLARQGHRVLVIEADLKEPHRIVGELLQPSGVEQLNKLGLQDVLLGIDAATTTGYGIFMNERPPATFNMHGTDLLPQTNYTTLPLVYPQGQGRAFHNGRVLMRLREAAAQAGVVLRQGIVKKLLRRPASGGAPETVSGVEYTTAEGKVQVARAHMIVVTEGCISPLRAAVHDNNVISNSKFGGLILRDCPLPLPNRGHVILAKPSPILMYPISSTETRMLVDFPNQMGIPNTTNGDLQHYLLNRVLPQLPPAVHNSFRAAVEAKGFQSMPNCRLQASPLQHQEGVLVVGDTLNMRHPLTGGGMTVAFTDVVKLRSLFPKGFDFTNHKLVSSTTQKFYRIRRADNRPINILADALYGVFTGSGCPEIQIGCFKYLSNGGLWSDGPMRLLSGTSRNFWLLFSHFFAVAFYGGFQQLKPFPTPRGLLGGLNIFRTALRIILPLLDQEFPGVLVPALSDVLRLMFWVKKV